MATLKFASSHNMVVFLDKPTESDGFKKIVDFLNAHPIKYAVTVNPTIYTACIEQFWATAKVKTVNEEVQIQALVDKKKVIIIETSVISDLQLEDAEVFLDKQVEGMSKHKEIYVTPSHTKKVFANMKRRGNDFSGRDTPLFPTMIVQAQEQVGKGLEIPTDSHHTPTTTQPSISKPQKKQSRRKQRKDTEDPQLSGPTEPVTNDTDNVASERVKRLEKKGGSRTHRLRRLYEVGRSARVVSYKDEGLGDQEDASKQGRKIDEIDQDAEVTLVDETQGRYGDNLMFDTGVLDNEQDMAKKEVDMAEKDVSTAVTTASATTTVDELTLAQTLTKVQVANIRMLTTAATINPNVVKDNGKSKMVSLRKPLKKKIKIMVDDDICLKRLQRRIDKLI
ncbi:hypothetical protein Tco_0997206 [Tanacetum coccineum]